MANEMGKEILRAFIGVRADSSRVESDIAAAKAKAQRAAASGPGSSPSPGSVMMNAFFDTKSADIPPGILPASAARSAGRGIMGRIAQTIGAQVGAEAPSLVTSALVGGGIGASLRTAGSSIVKGLVGGTVGVFGAAVTGIAAGAVGFSYLNGKAQDAITKTIGGNLKAIDKAGSGTLDAVKVADEQLRELQTNLGAVDGGLGGIVNDTYETIKGFFTGDYTQTSSGLRETARQTEKAREIAMQNFRGLQNYSIGRSSQLEVSAQLERIAFSMESFARTNAVFGRK